MNNTSVGHIRAYLGRLTPQARSSLLVEIERKQLHGEDMPGSDIPWQNCGRSFAIAGSLGIAPAIHRVIFSSP